MAKDQVNIKCSDQIIVFSYNIFSDFTVTVQFDSENGEPNDIPPIDRDDAVMEKSIVHSDMFGSASVECRKFSVSNSIATKSCKVRPINSKIHEI